MQTGKPHLNSFAAGPESLESRPQIPGRACWNQGEEGKGERVYSPGCKHPACLDGLAFLSRGWELNYYCINSLDSLETIASLTPSSVALLCL